MSAPRVLHVISGLGTGGAESFLAQLAPALNVRGFTQRIVSLSGDGPMADVFELQGHIVDRLDVRGILKASRGIDRMLEIARTYGPDIIQGWMYHGDLFATLLHRRLQRRVRPRLFWNIRCSDLNLSSYSLQLRIVVNACIHLSGRPNVVIANSNVGGNHHLAAGYRPRRLEIIQNGVDANRFAPNSEARRSVRNALGLRPDEVTVIHVARVDPMKDHQNLLTAIASLSRAQVLLVGLGTEKLTLPPNARALGRRSDVEQLLAASDIVVSSSAYGEGFSNAIAEGMAAGLVPVATRVGDAPEIVGDTGVIVEPGNPERLVTALQSMIDLPASNRRAMGLAARDRICSRFSITTALRDYAKLYEEKPEKTAHACG